MPRVNWTLLCLAALACDGRYQVGRELGAQAMSFGGLPAMLPGGVSGGTMAVGGSSPIPPDDSPSGGGVPSLTLSTAVETGCGLRAGPPEPISEPIANYQTWWYHLEHLIWGEPHDPPMALPSELSYEQAGELVDLALDEAIAETGGIPGAAPFVRTLLGVPDGQSLSVPWDSLVVHDDVALLEVLLLHPYVLLQQPYNDERRGIFSEPLFLSTYPEISQRGNRLHEALLNQSVPAEPAGVRESFEAPAGATRRERMEAVQASASCADCHRVLDPPGFSLESYDELGQPRTLDQGKPVETHGVFRLMSVDGSIEFTDHSDLVGQLANSCVVNYGFADRFLRYALAASRSAVDVNADYPSDSARMRQAFVNGGRTYRALVKEFAQGPTLRSL